MKVLEIEQMTIIQGNGYASDACKAFSAGSALFAASALANFWNPFGASVLTGMVVIGVACVFV